MCISIHICMVLRHNYTIDGDEYANENWFAELINWLTKRWISKMNIINLTPCKTVMNLPVSNGAITKSYMCIETISI